MLAKPKIAMLTAEFLGAALLTTTFLVLMPLNAINFFVAASIGLVLALVVMLFSGISGAHANPAVTFGLWTARKIETIQALAYIAAQLLGALAAWQLFEYLTEKAVEGKDTTFDARIWLAELVGTFVLAMGVTAAITRGMDTLQTAVTYGLAVTVGVLIATTAAVGLVNPAVALGTQNLSSAYVFGPLLGGVLGVNLYLMLFAPGNARPPAIVTRRRTAAAKKRR